MEDYSVDSCVLSKYFRELQQEKKKLENKLEHLRMRKNDIESKLDTVSQKNLMLVQKNDNMARTVNVAKLRVQETLIQVDNLQKKNDEIQNVVSQVKEAIISEEQRSEKLQQSYLENFDNIANAFRNASHYYTETSLNQEKASWKSLVDQKENIVCNKKELNEIVFSKLDDMKINFEEPMNEEESPKSVWELYLEKKDAVRSTFELHIERKKSILDKLTEEVKTKLKNIQDLEAELELLKNSSTV
ncbi:uncharacterized protein LOC101241832 isoform X1 [Hydra vulgaris]|uniref:uncharacterized protein LOC101241832 isoform X1 n=1 Tax=Hydra vulgaris TaxID=6087 RepID=UPI001F5F4E21|nr:uncharacterized protein LOC101241832 [Hydra vulgaris]